jgi:nucleotide-binding universal stress UspA family protein
MFTKILVAVSASSPDSVLASAIDVARKYDARIFALHVVDRTPCIAGSVDYDFGVVAEAMEAHGREIVTHVKNVLDDPARPAETRMVMLPITGSTIGRVIASFAEESGCDLILLGERKSGWLRWLSEDVAANVRRGTGMPVQIVSGKVAGGSSRRAGALWTDAAGAR